mgnify:FL=1
MQPSIKYGRDLIHHYLNLSFIRDFRPIHKSYVPKLDKSFSVMMTNATENIIQLTMQRFDDLEEYYYGNQEFMEWFQPFQKPHGFYVHKQQGMSFLNLWRWEGNEILGEMVCLYGKDSEDAFAYAKIVGAIQNQDERESWIHMRPTLVRANNVFSIKSSM